MTFTMDLTVPRRIVRFARQYLLTRPDDWAYGRANRLEHWGFGLPNFVEAESELCNLFVGDVLDAATANPPLRRGMSQKPYPIPANWWFEGQGTHPHWIGGLNFELIQRDVLHPIPGDVLSDGDHVGIVTECQPDGYGGLQGTTISAPIYDTQDWTKNRLVENDWGFRPSQRGEVRISRHVSVESDYSTRVLSGRAQPEQYPRFY